MTFARRIGRGNAGNALATVEQPGTCERWHAAAQHACGRAAPRAASGAGRARDVIECALVQAVRDALLQHKRAGNPVPIWENGQVVWIPPEEIDVDS